MHSADYNHSLAHLVKVIRTRGLEGALLFPSIVPTELDCSVNWNGISVITTTKSILAPRFHSVVPNQFGNTMRVLEMLEARGCRRICAVFDELFDERTAHHFTAAVNWKPRERQTLFVPQDLDAVQRAELVAHWLAEQRPDAVFAQSDAVVAALPRLRTLKSPPSFQIISLGQHNSGGFPYLDECAELIGVAAVDLLGGMMYYHETGIPTHPRTTSIDGKLAFTRKVVGRMPALAETQGV